MIQSPGVKKIFLFDIGNVLVDFDFQVLMDRIAADSGGKADPPGPRDMEMHAAVERGEISDQEWVDYLNRAKGLSWTVEELTAIWRQMFTVNETGYRLFRESIARGLPVYTLSNIARHHVDAIKQNFPGFFDGASGLFLSYQMGARKPDPLIYRKVLDELGTEGRHCLFIDDLPENVEAARTAGLHALQFSTEKQIAAVCETVSGFFGWTFKQGKI